MSERQPVAHCPNAKCNAPIFPDHPVACCIQCDTLLPEDVQALLPKLQTTGAENEERSAALITQTVVDKKADSMADNFYIVSGLFIAGALVFCAIGLYKLYDNSSDARIVGGDAYNYIIYATRGTAFICAGIVCAVLSVAFAVFAHTAKMKALLKEKS